MSMHWASEYIGIPWKCGAQGPDAFDCWAFVREIQRARFGREVPIIDVDANDTRAVACAIRDHDERRRWIAVPEPAEGDAVLMAHARYPSHIGVWVDVDGGGVLHCVRGAGVVFQSRAALAAAGWGRLEYYRCTPTA